MAYVWVQQWVALPVVVEELMGDVPPDAGIGPTGRLTAEDEVQLPITQLPLQQGSQVQSRTAGANPSFYTQFSSLPSFPQRVEPSRPPPPQQSLGSFNPQVGQHQHGSTFNMGAMACALPGYGATSPNPTMQSSQHQQMQRRLSGASTLSVVYQLQQNLQHSQGASSLANPTSYVNFPQIHYGSAFGQAEAGHQQSFGPYCSSQQRVGGMQQPFPPYPQLSPQHFYFAQGQQPAAFAGQMGQFPTAYGDRPGQPGLSPLDTSALRGAGLGESGGAEGHSGKRNFQSANSSPLTSDFAAVQRLGSETNLGAIPRGPPRKPKQSGHALWVGNLPPGATVKDLKDHFSRDATKDIESLFLISKSNCAFVNYRTEAACAAAMQRFHDSRFQGVRLVCRLRRSSATSSGTPTGPSAMTGGRPSQASPPKSPLSEAHDEPSTPTQERVVEETVEVEASGLQKVPEKFFIVKSLTWQDLEQSVRTGIWATQAHNEDVLNKAYQVTNSRTVRYVTSNRADRDRLGGRECLSDIFGKQIRRIFRLRAHDVFDQRRC